MEDTHWVILDDFVRNCNRVLILIVMEDTHWGVSGRPSQVNQHGSLNPYCNGRYSLRVEIPCVSGKFFSSLNPYCNGRYSLSKTKWPFITSFGLVLILIVMEDTHWAFSSESTWKSVADVLILIVMEDTHWVNAALGW